MYLRGQDYKGGKHDKILCKILGDSYYVALKFFIMSKIHTKIAIKYSEK